MSLSLYIILSVCLLIGVIFVMLARTTKEDPVSLEPPKVRGGTLFVPTVPHHVKIAPPEIMQSRLVAEELFVDYTIPGFERGRKGGSARGSGEGSVDAPEVSTSLESSGPVSAAAEVLAAEAEAKKLEAEAAGLVNDPRNAEKLKAEEIAASLSKMRYEDSLGNTYVRDSESTSTFDLFFVQDVIVKPSVSANPDLDPANVGPGENFMLKRNGALKTFLTQTETFEIYEEIMERVQILLEDKKDGDGDVAVEFMRQLDKRDLEESKKNLLLTTFQKQNPEVVSGMYRAQTIFLNNNEEVEEFMTT